MSLLIFRLLFEDPPCGFYQSPAYFLYVSGCGGGGRKYQPTARLELQILSTEILLGEGQSDPEAEEDGPGELRERSPGQEHLCLSRVEDKTAKISEAAMPVVWGMLLVSFLGTVAGMGPWG